MVRKYKRRKLSVSGKNKVEVDLATLDRVKGLPCGELWLVDVNKCYRKLNIGSLALGEAVFFLIDQRDPKLHLCRTQGQVLELAVNDHKWGPGEDGYTLVEAPYKTMMGYRSPYPILAKH